MRMKGPGQVLFHVVTLKAGKSLQNDAADCSVRIREGIVHIYISAFGTVSAMITVRAVETFWVSEPLYRISSVTQVLTKP